MTLIISFAVFMAAIIACLLLGYPLLSALVVGLISFIAAGRSKGFPVKKTCSLWRAEE